ncbi:MAG: hypothetical protein CM1200mP24_07070 [Gammaproteobacteria bacterium]|nr:MAG: hypothetical protein CM1200mP24_07070 [Gammaproteobacteria bacterium]
MMEGAAFIASKKVVGSTSCPVIEMIEVGAGGGSIARVDSLGLLKVGRAVLVQSQGQHVTAWVVANRQLPMPTSCLVTLILVISWVAVCR